MKRKFLQVAAVAFAASMALTACNAGGKSGASGEVKVKSTAVADADPNAIIKVNATEPQRPLIPTDTAETGGGRVVDMLNAGLIYYDPETGEAKNELAESIKSDDFKTWTIKIKKDVKFSDDTPITADSFIKAWSYGANPKNAHLSSSFFELIDGFTAPPEDEKTEAPDVPELKGLKKVDDKTFTVTLKEATSDFGKRLGYTAYVPLPEVAFKDMKAYGENPTVTSGPYKMKDGGWKHKISIEVEKNDAYQGDRKAKNGGILYKIYTKPEPSYADVQSGNLDVVDQVPSGALATFANEFPDSHVNKPVAVFQSFTIPSDLEHFKQDEEGKLRRKAISMAIDREQICKTIFYSTRVPAKDFSSPSMSNYDAVLKQVKGADVLKFNKDEAKKLWEQADAISKYDGTFKIGYNADGGHKEWVDAVSNQLKNNLGIKAEGNPFPDFKGFRDAVVKHQLKGASRSGWQADYPGMNNFLLPIYVTGAGSNDGKYSNKKFDELVTRELNKTDDEDAQNKVLAEAQSILFDDLPAIPLWYSNVEGVWNKDKVGSVAYDWRSQPAYYAITKVAEK